jgi:hypothetical protein
MLPGNKFVSANDRELRGNKKRRQGQQGERIAAVEYLKRFCVRDMLLHLDQLLDGQVLGIHGSLGEKVTDHREDSAILTKDFRIPIGRDNFIFC